jgi:hypothetical protein
MKIVITSSLAAVAATWSSLMLFNCENSGLVVVATSSSSSSSSPKRHPLLPWTSKLLGGATSTTEADDKDNSDGGMVLGENEEATASLEISIPLSQSTSLSKNDAPLMKDIQMLTEILSDLVQYENPQVHDLYEEFLQYGQQR